MFVITKKTRNNLIEIICLKCFLMNLHICYEFGGQKLRVI